jgi:hypothetical protein
VVCYSQQEKHAVAIAGTSLRELRFSGAFVCLQVGEESPRANLYNWLKYSQLESSATFEKLRRSTTFTGASNAK